jgi:hypothetical protein
MGSLFDKLLILEYFKPISIDKLSYYFILIKSHFLKIHVRFWSWNDRSAKVKSLDASTRTVTLAEKINYGLTTG